MRGLDERGHQILEFGSILNVSAGGALFISRKRLYEHSRVLLESPAGIQSAEEESYAPRAFEARVVRATRLGRFYSYAARFNSPLHSS